MKRFLGQLALGLASALAAAPAAAQDYPRRPVQLVIPYTAGGATDVLARMVADGLSTRLGQRVVPENKPGAGAHHKDNTIHKTKEEASRDKEDHI